MESENEAISKMSVKKGKRKLTRGGVTLDMLQKRMDIFKLATGLQKLNEVRSNLFITHPPSWKLKDSQRG